MLINNINNANFTLLSHSNIKQRTVILMKSNLFYVAIILKAFVFNGRIFLQIMFYIYDKIFLAF